MNSKDLSFFFAILPHAEVEKMLGEIQCKAMHATAKEMARVFAAQPLEELTEQNLAALIAASLFKGANLMAVTLREEKNAGGESSDGRETCE